ncbi:PREDICTED: uncharacterized protein LOC109172456 isoform X2 [Ipomoea nil]|uniref:uncharacterized protein LOC109172456 isoform X2 n=1 Tax=Ipomoea nil TaxID=35883 RepID=UPI000901F7AF|nr:PREDICTED: uncharacterized protein LOC109172456 isoform X2 [Ipomoea nil]
MAVISGEEQSRETHNFAVLSNGGPNNQQYESLPKPYEVEIPITTDAPSSCQSHFNQKMNNADNYVPYILDINVEKGKLEAPKCAYGTARNLKAEDCLAREIASQLGGKLMQLLMNNSVELPKFASRDKCVTEKTCDTLTNRLRKYKRSASFNSRRVVLLFSILSIMGTIILIYLTLRVKQIGDGADSV